MKVEFVGRDGGSWLESQSTCMYAGCASGVGYVRSRLCWVVCGGWVRVYGCDYWSYSEGQYSK